MTERDGHTPCRGCTTAIPTPSMNEAGFCAACVRVLRLLSVLAEACDDNSGPRLTGAEDVRKRAAAWADGYEPE